MRGGAKLAGLVHPKASKGLLVVTLLLGLSFVASIPGAADTKLTAPDAAAYDAFGAAVALDGDTVLVGSEGDDDACPADPACNSGSVHVFVRGVPGWTHQTKLTASDATAGDVFGASVALSGDTAIIGAWGDASGGSDSGAVYVFVRTGTLWNQQAKLFPSDPENGALFGTSVAVDGDTALVGAYRHSHSAANSGSAYVFVRAGATWTEQAELIAADAGAFDQVGISVAVDGDTAVVGAWGDDHAGAASGSAYVFRRTGTTWNQQAKLTAWNADAGDFFGVSVAADGDTVLVGAQGKNLPFSWMGAAYVFVRTGTTWTSQADLVASDGFDGDEFGISVGLEGNTALVGAWGDDTNAGSAYVFTRTGMTWTEQAKLTAWDAAPNDAFGGSVAVGGGTAVVGSLWDDDACPANPSCNSGSAYIFDFQPPNNPPTLTFPPAPYDNGVDPDSGPPGTAFAFRVVYTDADDDPPAMIQLALDKAGVPVAGTPPLMTGVDPFDTTYADGKLYEVQAILVDAGTDYTLRFQASDTTGSAAPIDADAPDVIGSPPPSAVCPLSHGYWKNHEEEWPAGSLVLGTEAYDAADLHALLRAPPRGDASLILAHQLIAAKLNVASGADPTPITALITDTDSLLSTFSGRLPLGVHSSAAQGHTMTAAAGTLDEYNNGRLTPSCP